MATEEPALLVPLERWSPGYPVRLSLSSRGTALGTVGARHRPTAT